jgi:hypothetical protein
MHRKTKESLEKEDSIMTHKTHVESGDSQNTRVTGTTGVAGNSGGCRGTSVYNCKGSTATEDGHTHDRAQTLEASQSTRQDPNYDLVDHPIPDENLKLMCSPPLPR